MARLAFPNTLATALLKQRGPLRSYQWLWLLLCVAGALAAAGPRLLNQPVIYQTSSVAQVALPEDLTQRRGYASVVTNGPANAEFDAVSKIALSLLKIKDVNGQLVYPGLGAPGDSATFNVAFAPQADGRVVITATAPNADVAQRLADDAAEAFARSLRAAGGREIARNLMGWEVYAAYTGVPPRDEFQRDIRKIWILDAMHLNRAVEANDKTLTVDMLTDEDRSDLARALEVREQELSKIDLYALRGRIADPNIGPAEREQLKADELRLEAGLAAIRDTLDRLYRDYSAAYRPDAATAVFRADRAAPGVLVDRRIPLYLGLAALVGLVFGAFGVALDRSAGVMPKLRELWTYRELMRNLVLRDLRVRYKGSALGYLWTQLAPLLLMLVFLFVFSTLQKQAIALFPVFLITGLLPWNFCAEAVLSGSRSVIDNANLIKKVFFPREILPLVSVFSALLNFILSLPMMFLVMAVAQWLYAPLGGRLNFTWFIAYLPVLIVIETLFLAGIVFFTSALAVSFRDFVHLIGILIQFWFFLTPVVYALANLSLSPAQMQLMRWLNPMASLIEFYHEILYGGVVFVPGIPQPALPAVDSVFRVLLTSIVVLALGYWFFQRRSRTFGEAI